MTFNHEISAVTAYLHRDSHRTWDIIRLVILFELLSNSSKATSAGVSSTSAPVDLLTSAPASRNQLIFLASVAVPAVSLHPVTGR